MAPVGNCDRVGGKRAAGDPEAVAVHLNLKDLPAITQPNLDAGEPGRQRRVEMKHVRAHLDAEVAALDNIDDASHRADVDTLLRRAALNVFDVAVKGTEEQLPRPPPVGPSQHPGMSDPA